MERSFSENGLPNLARRVRLVTGCCGFRWDRQTCLYGCYLAEPVFGLRLVGGVRRGGGGARQGAKISKIGAQI